MRAPARSAPGCGPAYGRVSALVGVLAGAAICLLLILAAVPQARAQSQEQAQSGDAYQLQPGDIIEITVIEDPNLNRRLLIGPDGRISLPLAGSIVAAGRSLGQVQSAVQAGLAGNFVRPPTVTAALVALAPPGLPELEEEIELYSVYVLGEVNRPGRYDYESDKPISVLQALALAGGPGIFADRDQIQVRGLEEGGAETIRIFNYDAVEEGLGATLTTTLSDGAVIVVPERGLFD
jgi:polysaccharide export outer membrane protein